VENSHGTATASVAAAPQNGIGILGVWPGARAVNVPLETIPDSDGLITCDASGEAIDEAIKTGASVINMSYGSVNRCIPEWISIYFAVHRGMIPVAAAGNEFESGNPLEFPASLPHVVTVAATDLADRSAPFSNANAAIDLSAPGVGILAAVPPRLDSDGAPDGYQALDGTSFSAPMVSAGLAWVRAARPDLPVASVVQAVRLGARDVERPGWDSLTGFGILDIGKSLSLTPQQLPVPDPFEPNDNLVWVNGTAFGAREKAVWSGGAPAALEAHLDKQEDPVDVYRILVPGRKSARVTVIPRFGDPSLEVFSTAAESVNDETGLVASSRKAGSTKAERVTVRNRASKQRSFYIAIKPQGNSRYQERRYSLRVRS
jgi:subtilisin family serine protease